MKINNIIIKLIFKTFDKKAKNDIIMKKISFWHKKIEKKKRYDNNIFTILKIIHHFMVDFIILIIEKSLLLF